MAEMLNILQNVSQSGDLLNDVTDISNTLAMTRKGKKSVHIILIYHYSNHVYVFIINVVDFKLVMSYFKISLYLVHT
jgi:hypothetical protein